MRAPQDKIRIKLSGAANTAEVAETPLRVSEDAMLRLARLIGRQMAREQFEHARSGEQKAQRQNASGESS